MYKGKKTTSKKQSTLFSFVNKNKPNDKSVECTDDISESSNKSSDLHATVFENNDVANCSNSKSLKEKELRLLDDLITVREKKLSELKAEQEKCFKPHHTMIATKPPDNYIDKTTFLVNKYGTKRTHPDDKATTASTYKRYNKKTKVNVINKRYLKISLLKLHPWAIYTKESFESGPGLVKCGLCSLAKEKGCEMWHGGKITSEERWLDGSDCWTNINQEMRWCKHEDSEVHKNVINFLYNKSNSNIATDLQSTCKALLTQCQEKIDTFLPMY